MMHVLTLEICSHLEKLCKPSARFLFVKRTAATRKLFRQDVMKVYKTSSTRITNNFTQLGNIHRITNMTVNRTRKVKTLNYTQ